VTRGYHRDMRFRAVFFDVGETLVHPHPSFPELFAQVVSRAGHPRDADAVREVSHLVMAGFSDAAARRTLWTTSPERSRVFWTSVYGGMLEELELPGDDGLADTVYATFTDRANYRLFDDVVPTIRALGETGVILGIVSNFEAWLEDLLEDLDIRVAFPVRAISGVEGIEKPDPRIYELALERAGVRAAEAAFVGDNPEFDVDPPAELGMFPVLIDRRNRHPDIEAVTRITDLRALQGALA
jgi:putative hydrolase of the HAD superfamily